MSPRSFRSAAPPCRGHVFNRRVLPVQSGSAPFTIVAGPEHAILSAGLEAFDHRVDLKTGDLRLPKGCVTLLHDNAREERTHRLRAAGNDQAGLLDQGRLDESASDTGRLIGRPRYA